MTLRTLEYTTITLIAIIVVILLGRAVVIGRAQVRDGLREQDLTNLKHSLEQYFNDHNLYVGPPIRNAAEPLVCTSTGEDSWFFSDNSVLLKERFIDAIPHDVRENRGHQYKYCALLNTKKQPVGYILEAELEVPRKTGIFFDEDEDRKFHYRIMQDKGHITYRLCGGEESSCTPNE